MKPPNPCSYIKHVYYKDMPKKALAYLLITVSAFLAGRFSVRQPAPMAGEPTAITVSSSVLPIPESLGDAPKEVQADKGTAPQTDAFAEKVAEMLGAGNLDYGAFSDVVEAWVDHDPSGAIDFLVRGERRDDMLRWIISVWGRKHPEAASLWLAENEQLEGLDHAIEGLTQGIQKEDPESAMQWAKMIQDPSVQTRVLAASGFQRYRHDHEAAMNALADSGLPTGAQEAIKKSWADSWKRTAKRNSQNVSSVAAAARAAGAEFDTSSVEALIDQVREGMVIESGPFKGKFFGVPNLTALEGEALLQHLRLQGEGLAYTPGDE